MAPASSTESLPPLPRQLTAGGHPLDTGLGPFPNYHRKLANPSPGMTLLVV
jgi:hypothetical protein